MGCAVLEANGKNRGGGVPRVNARWYGGGKIGGVPVPVGHVYRWSEYQLRVGVAKFTGHRKPNLGILVFRHEDLQNLGSIERYRGFKPPRRARMTAPYSSTSVPWAWAIRMAVTGGVHGYLGNVYALKA
jgi:hypothetical protein